METPASPGNGATPGLEMTACRPRNVFLPASVHSSTSGNETYSGPSKKEKHGSLSALKTTERKVPMGDCCETGRYRSEVARELIRRMTARWSRSGNDAMR